MTNAKKRISKELNEEEIEYYFTLLNENVTDYDCGDLCKKYYNGVPYCCSAEHAVPLLYRAEFRHLQLVGTLWRRWIPKTAEDRKLARYGGGDQLFCECAGVQHCVRGQRSVSCRTFPLEPYIDRRGVFVGLTFLEEFSNRDPDTGITKCPLTERPRDIRQKFIDTQFVFWEKILFRRKDEYDTYLSTSKKLRKNRDTKNKKYTIFLPSHLKNSMLIGEYL
jgi:hypothetical protein